MDKPANFVLKSSFDDPKRRWDEETKSGSKLMCMLTFELVSSVAISLNLMGRRIGGVMRLENEEWFFLGSYLGSMRLSWTR